MGIESEVVIIVIVCVLISLGALYATWGIAMQILMSSLNEDFTDYRMDKFYTKQRDFRPTATMIFRVIWWGVIAWPILIVQYACLR